MSKLNNIIHYCNFHLQSFWRIHHVVNVKLYSMNMVIVSRLNLQTTPPLHISMCDLKLFPKMFVHNLSNQTIEYVVTKDGGNQHSNKFFCNGKSHEFKASTIDTRMLINEMYLRECENYFVSSLIVL